MGRYRTALIACLVLLSCLAALLIGDRVDTIDIDVDVVSESGLLVLSDNGPTLTIISFCGPDNEDIGKLEIKDGKFTFEGNADESAKAFFDHVIKLYMDPYGQGFKDGRAIEAQGEGKE